ncbi:Tripartite tricarboxylate transporter TctB family protein [Franzmannia pantelleriensis]|uniref:Tripartite tricarboxylate transporter TctB family protein n=1 Tax=Franzmannia pantelleriensis TaxID=48727 RepID=A0A1G9X086_9GAMM|nr:tripartite tricarboxylate transporter TctB family protein [Halomonas pantelleriensis]SDM90117.1 Tripartite tricarboxylate transporter TctB family protein [Halomonas pantelleriensis]
MRLFFYLFILVVAICYTYIAFVDLTFFTNRGRMGPGFFPRILGLAMVIAMLLVILGDIKKNTLFSGTQDSQYKDAAVLIGFSLTFGVLLMVFGYVVAIPAYIGATLFYFNRGKYVTNAVVVVAVPVVIHFLFGSLLNASLPHGLWW